MYWHLIPVPFALFVIHRCLPARRRNNLERVAVVQPLGTALIIGIAALSPLYFPGV